MSALVGPDGWIRFSPAEWARISTLVEKMLLDQRLRDGGGYSRLGEELVHAASRAATAQIVIPDPVSLGSVPQTEPSGRASCHIGSAMMPVLTEKAITIAEAARRRGCSASLLRRLARTGAVRAEKHGGVWLVAADQFPTEQED